MSSIGSYVKYIWGAIVLAWSISLVVKIILASNIDMSPVIDSIGTAANTAIFNFMDMGLNTVKAITGGR